MEKEVKKSKKWIIAAIAALAVIVLGIVAFLYKKPQTPKEKEQVFLSFRCKDNTFP